MRRIINRHPGPCRLCGQDVDAQQGHAVQDTQGARWEVEHQTPCPPNPHNPANAPTWTIGGGEHYGTERFEPGCTSRQQWRTGRGGPEADTVPGGVVLFEQGGQREVSGIITVVTAEERFYREDGMSFGVGDDTGFYFSAQVRAATAQEAAEVLDTEADQRARAELTARTERLLGWRYGRRVTDSEYPPKGDPALAVLDGLPQVPIRPHDDRPLHGDRLYLDEPGGWLWTVVHNGMDGDDWSFNNVPGHIVRRHPLTDERRQLVTDLTARYASTAEWQRAGIPENVARILIAAGITLQAITSYSTSVLVGTEADAHAYLARDEDAWQAAGWRWGRGGKWPASDAARLADAGITCDRAGLLRETGHDTVEKILAAEPPQLPDTGGRYILRDGRLGYLTEVTDDPVVAQAQLNRDPHTWAGWSHTAGVTAVHVAGHRSRSGWQLWSDGELTIGGWRPADYTAPKPASLPAQVVQVLDMLVAANNFDPADRPFWQPLLTTATYTKQQLDSDKDHRGGSGEEAELLRHDMVLDDQSVVTFWTVRAGWWHLGEDGDAGEDSWISTSESGARQVYREQRPKKRSAPMR
ncbi:hypothetical protein D5S17_36165 [Pseudonocardiaceae bacterium YIM PH 21723]|nr:hypothetical protein D5S17_36165 [Pseudonocardiaceae bacterium YIM PH 21723]